MQSAKKKRHPNNPPARDRTIVKVQGASDGAHILIYAVGREGMQYRTRGGVPHEILTQLDRTKKPVFAFAYADINGRWRLENIAPQQNW